MKTSKISNILMGPVKKKKGIIVQVPKYSIFRHFTRSAPADCRGGLEYLPNDRIAAYHTRNNFANPGNILIKRTCDIVVGLIIYLIPVLAVIAIAITINSPGAVDFCHRRVRSPIHGAPLKIL